MDLSNVYSSGLLRWYWGNDLQITGEATETNIRVNGPHEW